MDTSSILIVKHWTQTSRNLKISSNMCPDHIDFQDVVSIGFDQAEERSIFLEFTRVALDQAIIQTLFSMRF